MDNLSNWLILSETKPLNIDFEKLPRTLCPLRNSNCLVTERYSNFEPSGWGARARKTLFQSNRFSSLWRKEGSDQDPVDIQRNLANHLTKYNL